MYTVQCGAAFQELHQAARRSEVRQEGQLSVTPIICYFRAQSTGPALLAG